MKSLPSKLLKGSVEFKASDSKLTRPQLQVKYPKAHSKEFIRASLNQANLAKGGDRILAEGDSWFDFPFPLFHPYGNDVIDSLMINWGYVAEPREAKAGDTIANMASAKNIKKIHARLLAEKPKAFLLSGGGNDLVSKKKGKVSYLEDMLNPKGSVSLYNNRKLAAFLVRTRKNYSKLIEAAIQTKTPIVLHNYAYARVTGKATIGIWKFGVIGPWLWPAFKNRGYKKNSKEANHAMAYLIEKMSDMIIGLAYKKQFRGWVRVVNNLNRIKKEHWQDEFHLNPKGWWLVAHNIDAAIQHTGKSVALYD